MIKVFAMKRLKLIPNLNFYARYPDLLVFTMKDIIKPSITNQVFSKFRGSPFSQQQNDHVEIQKFKFHPNIVIKHASLVRFPRNRSRSKRRSKPLTSVVDSGSGAFLTPGSRTGKKSGSEIRDEQPESYFRELRNNFLVKIFKTWMRIRNL
jgi:hypothetical protein